MPTLKEFLTTQANGNVVPIKPYAVLTWLTDTHGGARPLTAGVIQLIAEGLIKSSVDVKKIGLPVPLVALQGTDAQLAAAILAANVNGMDMSRQQIFKAGVQMIIGMALNTGQWDYSPVKFYRRATSSEVQTGWTTDFGTKHVSTTKNAKSAKNVAVERAKGVDDKTIGSLGRIVTIRSGAIIQQESAAFAKEIKGRQKEFTDLHKRLTTYRSTSWKSENVNGQFSYIDHVTFRTESSYTMYEFENARGGEAKRFIDFSVSADSQGTGWAVHHLSGAHIDNNAVDAGHSASLILGAQQGQPVISPSTTILDRLA